MAWPRRPAALLAALPVLAGGQAAAVAFSLRAAGKACANAREVADATGSAEDCAALACASASCGPVFQMGAGQSCACLAPSQVCDETDDPSASYYEISDTSTCAHRAGEQTTHDCFAQLFETSFFSGWSARFGEGAHAGGDLAAAGGADNDASSIFVSGDGCFATVYQHADFSGWSATFPEGSHSGDEFLAGGAVDDDASAIVVHFGEEASRPAGGAPTASSRLPSREAPERAIGPAGAEEAPTLKGRLADAARSVFSHVGSRPTPPTPPRRASPAPTTAMSWDTPCNPATRAQCSADEQAFIDRVIKTLGFDRSSLIGEATRLKSKHAFLKGDKKEWIVKQVSILRKLASAEQQKSEL